MTAERIRTAFIFGAGLGTRLRPLTERLPKPLLPIGGRPLITRVMDHCLTAGVERFIVNTHHCAAAYDEAFPERSWRGRPVLLRHEPRLLDTAGGLKNIEALLEADDAILVYNGDVLSDLPLAPLLAAHAAAGREVTLALRSDGPQRNVCVDATGAICDFRDLLGRPGVRRCLFTGISIVGRRFLDRLTPGRAESTVPIFARMVAASPGSVASVVIDAGTWEDIGDIATYRRLEAGRPAGGPRLPDTAASPLAPAAAAASAVTDARNPGGRTSVTAGAAGTGATKPTAAADPASPAAPGLPGGRPGALETPSAAGDAVATREEASLIRETFGLAAATPVRLTPVGKGGSDRSYFRVTAAGTAPSVLMRYGRMYEENDRYAAVAGFLAQIGVRVPAIFSHDPKRRILLMEDLGDRDLYALRDAPWPARRALYERTLAAAARLAAFPLELLPTGLRLMPGFDAGLYRWERDYFREHCVRGICGLTPGPADERTLEAELSALAGRLLATPPALVHRDLQSQNVMVVDGEPVLIDFQGMRPGSPFYDVASLLCDPYVHFPDAGRDELLGFHHRISGSTEPRERHRELFLLAAAQRLMQALGAYGFLGLVRGKPHFLAHVAPALANLVSVSGEAATLPHLHALARRCQQRVAVGIPPGAAR